MIHSIIMASSDVRRRSQKAQLFMVELATLIQINVISSIAADIWLFPFHCVHKSVVRAALFAAAKSTLPTTPVCTTCQVILQQQFELAVALRLEVWQRSLCPTIVHNDDDSCNNRTQDLDPSHGSKAVEQHFQ